MLAAGTARMGARGPSLRPARRSAAAPRCRRLSMRQGVAQCTAASPQWPSRLAVARQQQPAVLLAVQAAVAVQMAVSSLRDGLSRAFPQLQGVGKDVSATRRPRQIDARVLRVGLRRACIACTTGSRHDMLWPRL